MFNKILIANRGEIAVRVIKTARFMGIETVAVYSDADANALHTRMADEAINIGPAAAAESYLVIDKVIDAARRTGAEAIHPGYGFLSENVAFAEACAASGVVFIGPNIDAIRIMGSKSLSKELMAQSDVPIAPGYHGDNQSPELFAREADRIGYPILLKASMGGGGKGMRLVENPEKLERALASAKREAMSAFGDDRFLIEKFISTPRHIEVQVFGDTHGNIVHLFERDCTIQRRHQKVIEEAPAPNLPDPVRTRLFEAALSAAKSVNYVGAGTVEFLYDGGEEVYFMEMNTRLQVEHTVTEEITGIDLVEWQLRVAANETLPRTQKEISCSGHAFEARLYAERPEMNFLPSTGTVETLSLPHHIDGARFDMGVAQGNAVTPYYDPMIGKLIAKGRDRHEALARLRAVLAGTHIAGLEHNVQFLHAIASNPDFADGQIDTGFVDNHPDTIIASDQPPLAAYAAAYLWTASLRQSGEDTWDTLQGYRMNANNTDRLHLKVSGERHSVTVSSNRNGMTLSFGDQSATLLDVDIDGQTISFALDGQRHTLFCCASQENIRVFVGAEPFDLTPWVPDYSTTDDGQSSLLAPMPGIVTVLSAEPGAEVKKGDILLILEAMKMEYAVEAPSDGTLVGHNFNVGDQLQQGDLLVDFAPTL
jgi:3-methylcrotonyl-CoA carboxylase alpha subunit